MTEYDDLGAEITDIWWAHENLLGSWTIERYNGQVGQIDTEEDANSVVRDHNKGRLT